MGSQYRPQARDARELEAGLPIAQLEKAGLTSTPSTHPEPRDQPQQSMLTPRRLFLGLAVCLVLWLGLTTAAPTRQNSCLPPHDVKDASSGSAQAPLPGSTKDMASSTETESPFACLMDAVSPEALHEVLHRYFPNRFKDGVYESDHSAMEAVHRANPPLATSLARIARRQNGTAPGPTTATTTTPPVDTNTPTTQLPRVTPTPNTTPSVSTTSTTRSQSSNPGTLTSLTSSRPASSLSTLTGSVVSTTTSVAAKTSSGVDAETTTPPTRTSSSTPRPQKPQTTTYTSTASNGEVTVVTATTFVPAEPAETADRTQAGGSLQTNAAVARPRGVGVEALAGVVIGGLFLV
ncbi:hypothetical protein RB594_009114 [Gaeumannomyces avenae]